MNTKKLKITFIINDLLLGGAQTVVAGLADKINKDKFEVEVCYLFNKPDRPTLLKEFDGIKVRTVLVNSDGWIKKIINTTRFLRKSQPDIIHCHLPVSIIIGVIAGKFSGVKKIIAHHHNTYDFYSWKINVLLSIVDFLVDLNICYTDIVEREMFGTVNILNGTPGYIKGRSCTVFNSIDTERIESVLHSIDRDDIRKTIGLSHKDIIIVAPARLIDWKGQGELIRSMANVVKECHEAKLVILGEGPLKEKYLGMINEFNLSKNVFLLSPRSDIFEIFATSDIFSLPYVYNNSIKTKEALGVSALEAMAFGLPIVVSYYPSADKFVKDGESGIMVQPGDINAISKAIISLAKDAKLREKIGNNAHRFIKNNLSLNKTVGIYQNIYRDLIMNETI